MSEQDDNLRVQLNSIAETMRASGSFYDQPPREPDTRHSPLWFAVWAAAFARQFRSVNADRSAKYAVLCADEAEAAYARLNVPFRKDGDQP